MTLIARALAQGAETLIMDESLNGLDYGNQIRVLECITQLAAGGYIFLKTTQKMQQKISAAFFRRL